MSHRPGHIDNPGGGTLSMDRRKYLKALAIGSVAAGTLLIESCSPKNKGVVSWGYLSLYNTDVTTIKGAIALGPPKGGDDRIIIPFFNSNEIDLNKGDVVGFHLMKIGCPPLFAIAVNLVTVADDHEDKEAEARNVAMDKFLMEELNFKKEPWSPAPTKPC